MPRKTTFLNSDPGSLMSNYNNHTNYRTIELLCTPKVKPNSEHALFKEEPKAHSLNSEHLVPTPILKSVPSQFSPCVCEITNTCHVLRNNSFPKSTQQKTNFKQLKHKVFSVSPTHAREARKRGTQHKSQFQHVQSTVNELYE